MTQLGLFTTIVLLLVSGNDAFSILPSTSTGPPLSKPLNLQHAPSSQRSSPGFMLLAAKSEQAGDDDDDDDEDDRQREYARVRRRRGGRAYYDDEDDVEPDDGGYRRYLDNDDPRSDTNDIGDYYDDDDDEDYYDDDDDEDLEDVDEEYSFFGNAIIPNPLLDSIDPDGAAERFPELARDPRFWFDMLLFVSVLDFLSYVGPRDNLPGIPYY